MQEVNRTQEASICDTGAERSLSSKIYDECGPGFLPEANKRGSDNGLGQLGFPSVEFSGLDKGSGGKKDGLKELAERSDRPADQFSTGEGAGSSAADKLRRVVEGQMSPQERRQYEKENEAMAKYKQELSSWGLLATIEPSPMPKAPDCPMHETVNKRMRDAERVIEKQVRDGMSPEEQKQLDREYREYKEALKKDREPGDPLGTGGLTRPRARPGSAVNAYYRRVNEAVDAYARRH